MKYVLLLLCALGIVVSSLALREHYRTEGFDRLAKQSESEKQNGKTAYASHEARF